MPGFKGRDKQMRQQALPLIISLPGPEEAKSARMRRHSALRRQTFNRFSKMGKARIVASPISMVKANKTRPVPAATKFRRVQQLALASHWELAPTHPGQCDVSARPKKIRGHTCKPNHQKPHSCVTPKPGGSMSSMKTTVTQTSHISNHRPQFRKPRSAE